MTQNPDEKPFSIDGCHALKSSGPQVAQLALFYGANDFGSLMIEENVVAAAGVSFSMTRSDIHKVIRTAGFTPVQRTMDYTPVVPQPEV